MITNSNSPARYWKILLPLGILIVVWGFIGLTQMGYRGQGGFETNASGTVRHVEPDGPADRAGLKEGDLILAVGDTPGKGLWKKPFPGGVAVGDTQSLTVKRNGQSIAVEIVWESLSSKARRAQVVDFLVTLAFLGYGLWALRVSGNSGGLLLATFGLAYGAANFDGPGCGLPESTIVFIQSQMSLFYTALLAHFLLVFPKPKALFRKRVTVCLFYFPFVIYLTFGLVAGFKFPALGNEYTVTTAAIDLTYMLLALAALILHLAKGPEPDHSNGIEDSHRHGSDVQESVFGPTCRPSLMPLTHGFEVVGSSLVREPQDEIIPRMSHVPPLNKGCLVVFLGLVKNAEEMVQEFLLLG